MVDTATTRHVTPYKEFFSSSIFVNFGVLKMGNNVESQVVGIENVYLETNNGAQLILKDVRHVPNIRLNLILVGKLDDEGYCNDFGGGK